MAILPAAIHNLKFGKETASVRTAAEFRIEFLRYLDAEGAAASDLPGFAHDAAEMQRMFSEMLRARIFDGKAVNLQRTGKLGTYAPCLGQEASHIGVAASLKPEDCVAIVYREVGTLLWRGVRMTDVLMYWGGDERGNDYAVPRHDFPWCVPIATQTLHAAGAAMAFKLRKEKRCAVAFIGDGGTSEGTFYEAMNLAGARQLPAIFVVVNNGWAISVPLAEQTATETLAQKAIAAGIPGIQVDGNDVIAVREVMTRAAERARNGEGPMVVEMLSYRLSDHTTADDASRYRPKAELEAAWKLEPLVRLRKYMTARGMLTEAMEAQMKEQHTREVDAAVAEYLGTPPQGTDAMFDFLYANPPRYIEQQKAMARRYAGRVKAHGSH